MSRPSPNRRVEPKNWKKLERHPLSALYADIEGTAWTAFVKNVKDHGNASKRKVILHEGKVLDGWQFYRACKVLGFTIKPEFGVLPKGVTPEDYVETVNDHRRHETQAQALERIEERRKRVVEAREAGKSLRTIAADEGVDPMTVHKDLEKSSGVDPSTPEPSAETNGHTANPRVTGRDGKTYPATKPVEREPGDDSTAERAEAEAPRPGAIIWQRKKFDQGWGILVREIDNLGRGYRAKETPEAEGLRRLLKEYKDQFFAWEKALKKASRSR